jgi:hypothetical protein
VSYRWASRLFWITALLALLAFLFWWLTPEAYADPDRFVDAPGGRLTFDRSEHPPREALERAGRESSPAFWMILDSESTHAWFRVAAAWDSTIVWPRGRTVTVQLKDGTELDAVHVMAVIAVGFPPVGRPMMMGIADRRIDPGDVVRRRWRGQLVTMLFVAFPDPRVSLGDITGVQVRQRSLTAAPAR